MANREPRCLADAGGPEKIGHMSEYLLSVEWKKIRECRVTYQEENKGVRSFKGPDQWEAIKKLQGEIEFLMEREDLRWKQRSKQNWYQNGDRNTPFFHAWADHRRRINHIQAIKDEDG